MRTNPLAVPLRGSSASFWRLRSPKVPGSGCFSVHAAVMTSVLVCVSHGCLQAQPAGKESGYDIATEFASRHARYRIQPSDVVEISFQFTPEFNLVASVQPDGFISLQSAGELKIAGLTTQEAAAAISEKYAQILRDPVVGVSLKDFEKPSFVVSGEVSKPGRFDLRGEMTLTDAIAVAGGLNLGAKSSGVLLFRRISADTVEVKKINVKHRLKDVHFDEDTRLQPGDSIYVGESRFGKVDHFMKVTRLGLYFPIPIP
jgi:polysaccharide biosynthesis/export protein